MPFLASAVRASDPFPATSVWALDISVSGNFCATKLSAGKLILDHIATHDDATALPVEKPVAKRKVYMCPTCHVPKKGHVCPAPKKRKGAVVKRAGKRARK